MVTGKASLQHKVLLGYMVLIMAVCGMVISRNSSLMESPLLSGRMPIFVSIAENACKRIVYYKY